MAHSGNTELTRSTVISESPDLLALADMEEPSAIVWLSPAQVARDYLGVLPTTVYNWINRGYGPPVHTFNGYHYKYKKTDVEEWMRVRKTNTEDPIYRVLSVVEAAKMLGVHKNTLLMWFHKGKGPPFYIFNGKYVLRMVEIEQWMGQNVDSTKTSDIESR